MSVYEVGSERERETMISADDFWINRNVVDGTNSRAAWEQASRRRSSTRDEL
jgi:hypothetical protein